MGISYRQNVLPTGTRSVRRPRTMGVVDWYHGMCWLPSEEALLKAACLTNAKMPELLQLFPDRSYGSIAAKRHSLGYPRR